MKTWKSHVVVKEEVSRRTSYKFDSDYIIETTQINDILIKIIKITTLSQEIIIFPLKEFFSVEVTLQ